MSELARLRWEMLPDVVRRLGVGVCAGGFLDVGEERELPSLAWDVEGELAVGDRMGELPAPMIAS